MLVSTLGRLAVHRGDGTEIELGGALERRVLSALAVKGGQLASVDALAEAVFGELGSTSATIRLQNHVSRLRKRLGTSAVLTVPRGYRLNPDGVELDWLRFEHLLAAAGSAATPATTASLLEEALALWQGEPFAEVEEWEPARALATRLAELCRVAEEDHAFALIAAGRSSAAVGALEAMATQEPLRERRWSLLMLALYRCARQADALRMYQRACEALAEIGLEPGPELRHLEQAISVHADDALGAEPVASSTPRSTAASVVAPDAVEPEPGGLRRSNVPSPADSFVGRQRELGQVADALIAHQLVTILGAGGMGKTRLALEAAARTEGFDDGHWFVDLGTVRVDDDVDRAVAAVIGVGPPPGVAAADVIAEWCSRLHALIVLDNCEHVLDGVGRLMGNVLSRQPVATFLATSREPLLLAGEHVLPLGPLSVVSDTCAESEALALLIDRVRAERPDFDPTAERTTLAEICVRLDGMPLALELAAGRLRALTPTAVAERLDERFRLLTGGRRDAVERHKTLRATLDWSYDLLDDTQRRLFEQISVFSAPFGLEDVAAIHRAGLADLADTTPIDVDVVAHLAELVDRSLVTVTSDEPPYGMLETLRAYGRERLVLSGMTDEVRERHSEWFAAKAAQTRADACGPADHTAWTWAIAQNPDYVAAATWAVEHGRAYAGMRIAHDLVAAFWTRTATAFTAWAAPLAEHVTDTNPAARALANLHIAGNYQFNGDLDLADGYFEAAIEADPTETFCHIQAAVSGLIRRNPEEVRARVTVAEALTSDDRAARAAIYILRANMHFFGRIEASREIAADFLRWARSVGWPGAIGHALFLLGCADQEAFPERARAAFDEADRIANEIDSHGLKGVLVRNRFAPLADQDPAAAAAGTIALLQSSRRQLDFVFASVGLAHATILLLAAGDGSTAARLVGMLDGPPMMSEADVNRYLQAKDELRRQLGDRFDQLVAQGAAAGFVELIDVACTALAAAYPTVQRPR